MRREIFTDEHDAFREMVGSFITAEIAPYHEQWESAMGRSRARCGWRPGGPGCFRYR